MSKIMYFELRPKEARRAISHVVTVRPKPRAAASSPCLRHSALSITSGSLPTHLRPSLSLPPFCGAPKKALLPQLLADAMRSLG